MIIDRKIEKYIVYSENAVRTAIEKMDANNMRVVFVLNETGVLEGIITDGDFRRWVLRQENVDLDHKVIEVANKQFLFCNYGDDSKLISSKFSNRIDFIPLVDKSMHLLAVASIRKPKITVGGFSISKESPTFIIAEVGNNHNGDLEFAKKMVDKAIESGANCVKFQMRDMESLYSNKGDANDAEEDLGSQYVLDLLSKFQLSDNQLKEIFDYCDGRGVVPLCTPWDKKSVDFLDDYGIEAFKVASADFINHELLTVIAAKGKPMLCSTGMCTEPEIKAGVKLLRRLGAQFVLLHCNSTYPSPFKDINLQYIRRLQELSENIVGYSGHERGINVVLASVAMGAKVIEKHFTLDREMEGNDHKVSLLPDEFARMVKAIREIEESLGTDKSRTISQGELINRENLAKSLVINCDLNTGETITKEMIEVKSPGKGLPPYRINDLVGMQSRRFFAKGDFFYDSDLNGESVEPRDFSFIHPFGIPVRYHDYKTLSKACNMDLLEIHLSYKDLEVNINDFFDEPISCDLVVHSPELFSGDHILDLSSSDSAYRKRSILELQRVINTTIQLKEYFPQSSCPRIVVNVGGFSDNDFISVSRKSEKYEVLAESLLQLNAEGVEIIPQTMPPFPWHFGGQRFHNLFVASEEILQFCKNHKYRICLDVSHSKLACNYSKYSFSQFLEEVAPVTAHLHIADASGVDGEGLQIHEGEIDFIQLMSKLRSLFPSVSFIPEVWQGHKNDGQGFWVALDKLERATLNN